MLHAVRRVDLQQVKGLTANVCEQDMRLLL